MFIQIAMLSQNSAKSNIKMKIIKRLFQEDGWLPAVRLTGFNPLLVSKLYVGSETSKCFSSFVSSTTKLVGDVVLSSCRLCSPPPVAVDLTLG